MTTVSGVTDNVKIKKYPSEVNYGDDCTIEWSSLDNTYTFQIIYAIGEILHTEHVASGKTSHTIKIDKETLEGVELQIKKTSSKMMVTLLVFDENNDLRGSHAVKIKICITEEIQNGVFKPEVKGLNVIPDPQIFGGIFVKGYTKPKFILNTDAGLGSEITKCFIEENYGGTLSNIDFSPESVDGEIIHYGKIYNKDGGFSYTVQVENQRGFMSNVASSNAITVYDYYSPSVEMLQAQRAETDSTQINLKFQCSFASVDGKNSATATVQYKEEGSTQWLDFDNFKDKTISTDPIPTLIGYGFKEDKSYNFRVTVIDALGETASKTLFTPRLDVLLHYPEEQKGFGIGKYVDNGNFEVGLDSEFFENVSMHQNLEVDGLISGANFGRFVYSGDNCIESLKNGTDALTGVKSYKIRMYLIKPFNFVYLRMYIKGLGLTKDLNNYTRLCKFKKEFKPAWVTPFAVSGGMNCDIKMGVDGVLSVIPWSDINGDTSNIYIAGFYPLDGSSSLYVQNFSKTATLD